ncbi:hypothetical protein A3A93_03110 [Candidatus Roizmanbacteria bacterium RIFCSPLOWO2_01_FULL_38_12]|uniref:Uncharacterized protein n=1 Tax=Candidatus Roizmanbacteria bacterium RIFCSPLOWO2_01_FULL_38_12 TaxID=1802061 RepID=A0A1F7ISI4_9BACT|nr:MAG: hypothetical protein A2861_03775 [Candidatus Roizmanbacteria bacterium RIFCSPHIGHO2_01_FULL_38_15]OGK35522.1 MAG: hypothetical protein A3F59_05760 [Candidatus Roizmanbacteria bacterium RIFCSPHIGHO2_12_FULL_38_13]OGK46339.1 MAG: hypothetical protein A3A93_03110 [Candidatus Roizmanbacteria bacterium RIFCSPLOWO2_01_FULL_38_12]
MINITRTTEVQKKTNFFRTLQKNPFYKNLKNLKFRVIFFAFLFLLVIIITFSKYKFLAKDNKLDDASIKVNQTNASISKKPENSKNVGSNQSGNILKNPTATPKITIKITNTIAPTKRTSNPPVMNISFPSENQSITLTSSQQFCVVDTPAGGDQNGLQRRQNINNSGWSEYASITTLCFTPNEGQNSMILQYKNNSGDESTQYNRNFTFHKQQPITVTLNGRLYSDDNCNGSWDSGEGNVNGSSTVNIFKMPEFYILGTVQSGNDGTFNSFSYNHTINDGESISLQAVPVSPEGYKGNPNYSSQTVTLNKDSNNYLVNIPQVPNSNVSACQF